MAIQVERRLFTAEEFQQMAQAGILGEDDRVELIEGEIIHMAAIGYPHAACVNRLTKLLILRVPDEVIVSVQNAIRLAPRTVPQPDLAVIKPRADQYLKGHPTPDDILLFIEVSDSTLRFDRNVKVPLYAREGIVEVWIINLQKEVIEVYSNPANGVYQQRRRAQRGQSLTLQSLPQVTLDVDSIVGPAVSDG